MIGDDLAAALPELQAQAESMMRDTCTITVPVPGRGPWNEDAGDYDPVAPVALYVGKCRVRMPNVAGRSAEAGDADWTLTDRLVSIPLVSRDYALDDQGRQVRIPVGATVTIDAIGPTTDPNMLGATFTFEAPASQQTHPTARRMRCKEVE